MCWSHWWEYSSLLSNYISRYQWIHWRSDFPHQSHELGKCNSTSERRHQLLSQAVSKSPKLPSVFPIGLEITHWTLRLRSGIQRELCFTCLACTFLGPHGVFKKFFCIHCQKLKRDCAKKIFFQFLASLEQTGNPVRRVQFSTLVVVAPFG